MTKSSQHLLKRGSLFSMFCLSYSPLFLLLSIKILIENKEFAHFGSVNIEAFLIFLEHFGFISLLAILSFFAVIGTYITFSNLESKSANAFPAHILSHCCHKERWGFLSMQRLVSYSLFIIDFIQLQV